MPRTGKRSGRVLILGNKKAPGGRVKLCSQFISREQCTVLCTELCTVSVQEGD